MSAALTSLLLVPLLVPPARLLEWTFGEPFRAAALPLVVLTVASIANVASGLCGTALTMSHHEGTVAGVQAGSVLLRIVLGTAAALTFGLVGLAVVASAITVLTYVVLWRQARRLLGLRTEPTLHPRLGLLRGTAG